MEIQKLFKPHVYTIKLVGNTGNGKTKLTTILATKEARSVIERCVGPTNSTLSDRLLVYSENYTDTMIVAVKLKDEIFESNELTDLIFEAIAKVVRVSGKDVTRTVIRDEELLRDNLINILKKKNNAKATLSLLLAGDKEKLVDQTVELYRDCEFCKENYRIYNTVKNAVTNLGIKESSAKFDKALCEEVKNTFDQYPEETKVRLNGICNEINDKLKRIFFDYFSEEEISNDDYFYKEIALDSPDVDFVEAMFSANNMQAGEKISLEIMCSEIVIYLPMNKKILSMIKDDTKYGKVFLDNRGKVTFGIVDTRGLYHAAITEDDNKDYLSDLLYQGNVVALALLMPLVGDLNEKKVTELYINAFRTFNKQIPVFMINNKLDVFVDEKIKDNNDDDILNFDDKLNDLSNDEIVQLVDQRCEELREDFHTVQSKSRAGMQITSIPCYFKKTKNLKGDLIKKYSPLEMCKIVFDGVSNYLKGTANKIPFILSEEDAHIEVDKNILNQLVHDRKDNKLTEKEVFSPGLQNLAENIGITPHGNGYLALGRRLKNGDAYKSEIDDSYFYNCKSFDIRYPANVSNFLNDTFIKEAVTKAVSINGGNFEKDEDKMMFYNKVIENVDSKELASKLLYYNAYTDANKNAFGFYKKFKLFLENSMLYLNPSQISEEQYTSAILSILKDAAERALQMNVILK